MPHPPHTDRPTVWKCSLPSSLALQVEVRLLNPITGSVSWGARSSLIQALLKRWLDEQRRNPGASSEPNVDKSLAA